MSYFLFSPGEAQIPAPAMPKQVGVVANNLWDLRTKVGAFTLKTSARDHGTWCGTSP